MRCDPLGLSVVGIDLSNTPLQGSLPRAIGGIRSLTSLSLANASLIGELPTQLGLLTDLQVRDSE